MSEKDYLEVDKKSNDIISIDVNKRRGNISKGLKKYVGKIKKQNKGKLTKSTKKAFSLTKK